jgi:molybdopterin-guanine dinucleotide biosynthesis adapter protein
MPPVLSIVGWHNAGKTGLCVRLVELLKARGLRVAVIKHSVGGFEMDRPGTDTTRFAQAGADVVAIAGGTALAWLERLAEEIPLAELLARLPEGIDLVILEGFKREPVHKIEVMRAATGVEPIARPEELLAVVSDDVDDDRPAPHLRTDDMAGLLALLEARGLVPPAPA